MTFTTLAFWAFFILSFFIYWIRREKNWQNVILLAASLVFYASFHIYFLLLLAASILADHLVSQQMQKLDGAGVFSEA